MRLHFFISLIMHHVNGHEENQLTAIEILRHTTKSST